MIRDLRTLIYLLNLELREECSRTLDWNHSWGCKRMHAIGEADAIGEQQPKRTRSRAAAEADASGEHPAAAEAGEIGEQQLEADTDGEQQLKRMQSGPGAAADSKQMQAASSN